MASPTTTQQLRAAAILVVVAMAMAATATGAHHHHHHQVPPPPEEEEEDGLLGPFAIRVFCSGDPHGVRAGETCASVARDARIDLKTFMELNPNITCGKLFPGQWVCLNGGEVGK